MRAIASIISVVFSNLFGLVFCVAGGFFLNETALPMYKDWLYMQHWQPHQAQLLYVEGSDDETEAEYRYQVNGLWYENDRVYIAAFSDNIGGYHQTLQTQLKQLYHRQQDVEIWVNPNNPQDAVIDRNLRWGLFTFMSVFCSIFILIGLGVIYAGFKATKSPKFKPPSTAQLKREWAQQVNTSSAEQSFLAYRQQRINQLKKQAQADLSGPSQEAKDWKSRKGWQHNRIRSTSRVKMIVMWGFAIVWNLLTVPMIFNLSIQQEIEQGNYIVFVALLFPLAGLFLIYSAVKVTREFSRFGVIELVLDPFPGSIGGHVGGSLLIKNLREYDATYRIQLACIYSYVSGTSNNRSRHERFHWSEEGIARVDRTGEGIRLSFRFDVPEGLPEADIEQNGNYYYWRLDLTADLDGVDIDRSYNIPVFQTGGETSRHIEHDLSEQAQQLRAHEAKQAKAAMSRGDFHLTALSRVLKHRENGDELHVYFPMFRNKVMMVFALIFGVSFSFAAFAIVGEFGASGGFFSLLAYLFAVPFAIVALLGNLAGIYLPLNNLSVKIKPGQVKVMRRLLMFPISRRLIPAHSIKELTLKHTGSTHGRKRVDHYKILLHNDKGQKITIAEGIDGKDLALQFKDYLADRMC